MQRARRRKIEVPTDTQPQYELGDTAEDIERRRERDERERTGREGQREDDEREEGREPGKGARTDMATDVESTQSRQKGQMKS